LLTSADGVRWQKTEESRSDRQTDLCDVFAPGVRYVKLLNGGRGGVATWELYGDSAAGTDVSGRKNALQNPSFAAERVPVVWDTYDADMTNRVEKFTIFGTVTGTRRAPGPL
jgi:hypothetical protein